MRPVSLPIFCAIALLVIGARDASAGPINVPAYQQRLGAVVPLDLRLRDASGVPVRIGDLLGQRPAILIPGYFHCPNLCSTVLDGVLQGVARTGIDAEIIAFSIDPREGPKEADEKRTGYGRLLPVQRLHFLTGSAAETGQLAEAVGFSYVWDAERDQYLHPAGFLLLTPQGRIAHYVIGAAIDSRSLSEAVDRARAGRIDGITSGFALACASNASLIGRYGDAVLTALRLLALGSIGGFALWLRSRRIAPCDSTGDGGGKR